MLTVIKYIIFILIVIIIRMIFNYISEAEFIKIRYMKDLINFIEFLRIFSCDMKMQINEIVAKYKFKDVKVKKVCKELNNYINSSNNKEFKEDKFSEYIKETLLTPDEFNKIFVQIIDYYGYSTSEVLETKLLYTQKEMLKLTDDLQMQAKERKSFFNKISILIGILIAILLI